MSETGKTSEQIGARPLPEVDGRMRPFWDAARRGVLVLQRCSSCGTHRFPPGEICSACLGAELSWVEASGSGIIYSFVVVHHAVDSYFAAHIPYVVADVKLAEGPHMTTTVIDCAPTEIEIGVDVAVEFDAASDEIHLPVFRRRA